MKKLTVVIASLAFVLLSVNAQAHGFQNNRFGSYVGYSNALDYPFYSNAYSNSYSSPYYPSNSLVMGISYRNYNSRISLQNRIYNGRVSNNRIYNNHTYNNGYQNSYRGRYRNSYSKSYRNDRRDFNNNDYRSNRYNNNTCYESYYDRYGNRIERSLPASVCRH
ncbi:hypothetical protein N8303_04390 [Gammaproteobacteria bacterium]|nr:hypothetical protein [Gammaproteobacteria bacterium]